MKKKVFINYRNEFSAEIEAEGDTNDDIISDAINKFQKNQVEIKCSGNCWPEYFEIYDENDNLLNK